MGSDFHNEYRIAVVGADGVGKSALVAQFVTNQFVGMRSKIKPLNLSLAFTHVLLAANYDPTIEDSFRKQVEIDGQQCLLDILDTVQDTEYSNMREGYIRSAHALLIVYSVTSPQSLNEACGFRDKILHVRDHMPVPLLLIAAKSDLEADRQISTAEGQDLANKWGITFFETSSLNRVHVEECFFEAVRAIQRDRLKPKQNRKNTCIIQ
jgi:GTPase KRas protein